VLRLCCTGALKPLVFVSTCSDRSPEERVALAVLRAVARSGYALSKLAAEALVERAGAAGLPCLVLRCGLVSWHRTTGACNPDDILSRLLRSAVELGLAYDGEPAALLPMDGLPVDDFAALALDLARAHPWSRAGAAAVALSVAARPELQALDARALFDGLRGCGYPLERCTWAAWRQRAASAAAAAAILPHLPAGAGPPLGLRVGGARAQGAQAEGGLRPAASVAAVVSFLVGVRALPERP